MSEWRYIAQRALTGEFLEWELPMERDELSWALSGAGSLRGRLAPDVGLLRAADGGLLLDEWGTLLFAESGNQIRWGGILISSEFVDEEWQIEAAGFATYPHGIPYLGSYSKVQVDPADVISDIWGHVQSSPDGDLGVTVVGANTPVRLGKPETPAYQEVYLDGKWQRRDAVNGSRIVPDATSPLAASMTKGATELTLKDPDPFAKIPLPFDVTVGAEKITVQGRSGSKLTSLVRGVGTTNATAHSSGTDVKFKGTETRTVEKVAAEPYVLQWHEAPDCGQEIDNLAREGRLDYEERHRWDGNVIRHEIVLGYPRLGRRRDDLTFIQGDNISDVVTAQRHGDDYANEVVGIGAGEGAKSLRRQIPIRDGRLRRPVVYTDKGVASSSRLDALIRRELAWRRKTLEVTSVTVDDHPNARIGSWQLGDDVLIQAEIPWLGEIAVWSRIVGWSLVDDHRAQLSLVRSDSFEYGA